MEHNSLTLSVSVDQAVVLAVCVRVQRMFQRCAWMGLAVVSCSCHVSSRWEPADTGDAATLVMNMDAAATDAVTPAQLDAATMTQPAATFDAGTPASSARDAGADAQSGGDPNALPANVSFDTARKVPLASAEIWQTLHSVDQVDYYSFDAEAGRFYVLSTNRGNFSPDNVISLFDADHKLLAENDDGSLWPGDAIDARLLVRAAKSGTYYVVVEDRTTPPEYFDDRFASLYYQLMVRAIDADTPGFALESANDMAAAPAQFVNDARSGNVYVTLLGTLSEGDRDLFSFSGRADNALIGELLVPGPDGDGSTALLGRVRVASADQHAVGFIDRALGQHNIHPPVTDGMYQLTVSADGKPGDNGFYVINLTLLPDNPREQFTNSNDTLAMAEPLVWKGSVRRRSLLLAHVPPGDVDYYSFAVEDGDQILVGCEGESGGSGVHALRAEVRDELDKVLAFAVETADHNLLIERVPLMTKGMRYLRLSSDTAVKADMVEPWVRCVANAGP